MNCIRVNWKDARSIDGWCHLNDFNEELSIIRTCGFLIKENNIALFVSACESIDMDDGNQYACTIVIPKKMIIDSWMISDEKLIGEFIPNS